MLMVSGVLHNNIIDHKAVCGVLSDQNSDIVLI